MPWTTAVSDLRTQLSDGPTDRFYYRKRCFGEVNGINLQFKTFEFRRVTNFTLTAGVYIDGVLQLTSAVTADDLNTGLFNIKNTSVPFDGSIVEASYYTQWFQDTELQTFLGIAALWLLSTTDYTQVQGGLIAAALKYAAAEGYLKMAQRWRTYSSEGYKVEDAPRNEAEGKTDSFTSMAKTFRAEALSARDEFYKRQGRSLQPLFGTVRGKVRSMP